MPLKAQRFSRFAHLRLQRISHQWGRLLSKLPTDVHLGKFLLIAALFCCLDPALTIAAALNSKSPFLVPSRLRSRGWTCQSHLQIRYLLHILLFPLHVPTVAIGDSDFLTIHNAFSSWRKASANGSFVYKFCRTNYISHQVRFHFYWNQSH